MNINETEAGFQGRIIELAELQRWRVLNLSGNIADHIRNATGRGWPDLLLAHEQRGVVFAEIKTMKGKLSSDQIDWNRTLSRGIERRVSVEIWRPNSWPWVEELLTGKRRKQ